MGPQRIIRNESFQQQGPKIDPPNADTQCIRIHVILGAKDYFIDAATPGGISPNPPFPMEFAKLYSEVFDENKTLIAIAKHENVRFFSTGLITENVKNPSWWGKRDQGSLA